MAGIFTRKAIAAILNDEALTPEERTDQLFSLYGRALDDGYVTKSAAQAATNAAVETAKAEAVKDFKLPDVKESPEYKDLFALLLLPPRFSVSGLQRHIYTAWFQYACQVGGGTCV